MEVRALSWNLFHGRDHPPDPALVTWRSRLLRATERNAHPRPGEPRPARRVRRGARGGRLGRRAAAGVPAALGRRRSRRPPARPRTGRSPRATRSRRCAPWSARINPDLIASNEGGSNLTLVRGRITERTELELAAGPRPERRVMALTRAVPERAGTPVRVANLHASAGPALRSAAEREVLRGGGARRRLGGRRAADLRRRPQPASPRQRRLRRARASASGSAVRRPPAPSTTCSCADWIRSQPPHLAARAPRGDRRRARDPALRPRSGRGELRRPGNGAWPGRDREVR